MKTKQTRYKKVFLYLALPIFLAVFFVFVRSATARIVINEIMVGEDKFSNNEFVELYNDSKNDVILNNYKLKIKKTVTGLENYLVNDSVFKGIIKGNGYFVIAYPEYKEAINANLGYSTKSYPLANNNSVLLYDNLGTLVDLVGFGSAPLSEEKPALNPSVGQSIGRLEGKDTGDNSKDFAVQDPTPGKENVKLEEKIPDPLKIYSDKIQISELFPNPFQVKYEEYIEIYNGTANDVDLLGWKLHDASKSGEYIFLKSTMISAKKYLAIFKTDFKFALNNSGEESVTLFDPNGKEISKALYDGSKQNLSYNFDGDRWRWSKFLTPGDANVFNNEPYGTVKIDEDFFVNTYGDFSVSTGDGDGDKVSVTWDFGDRHKSYLAKTRHKYVKEGKYTGSVKLSDGSEDILKEFTIEVRQFPHPKVRIIGINANPDGADTGKESLTIKNQSNKKINLKGWSIATGWKKFTNHPIKEDVIIKKNKTEELTADVSSFTLNNTKAKIQLRYPDGKVAQEVKYKKANEISEGEIYQKVKGGWTWLQKISNDKLQIPNKIQNSIDNSQEAIDNNQNTIISLSSVISNQSSEIQNTDEGIGEEVGRRVEIKRENRLLKNNSELVKIELLKTQPRVLGAETVREVGGQYFFTPQVEQKHYLISFWEKLLASLNAGMNHVLNYF